MGSMESSTQSISYMESSLTFDSDSARKTFSRAPRAASVRGHTCSDSDIRVSRHTHRTPPELGCWSQSLLKLLSSLLLAFVALALLGRAAQAEPDSLASDRPLGPTKIAVTIDD